MTTENDAKILAKVITTLDNEYVSIRNHYTSLGIDDENDGYLSTQLVDRMIFIKLLKKSILKEFGLDEFDIHEGNKS